MRLNKEKRKCLLPKLESNHMSKKSLVVYVIKNIAQYVWNGVHDATDYISNQLLEFDKERRRENGC